MYCSVLSENYLPRDSALSHMCYVVTRPLGPDQLLYKIQPTSATVCRTGRLVPTAENDKMVASGTGKDVMYEYTHIPTCWRPYRALFVFAQQLSKVLPHHMTQVLRVACCLILIFILVFLALGNHPTGCI